VKADLVILTPGKLQGKPIRLGSVPFVIGRDAACQLRPQSSRISGRHCSLVIRDEQLFVRDLDSTNGTFVDGERLIHEKRLQGDERVQVGPLLFGVSIARSQSEPKSLRGNPPPPEATGKDAAAILLVTASDQALLSTVKDLDPPHDTLDVPSVEHGTNGAADLSQGLEEAADEDAAAMLLAMSDGEEPPYHGREDCPEDLSETDQAIPPVMPDEAEDEDAAAILLAMANDQEAPDNGVELPGDAFDEVDGSTAAQLSESMRLLSWKGFM
jgi:predicted component of type VI protein secretion system